MTLVLDPRLAEIAQQQPFPRFSDAEIERRRQSLLGVMQAMQVDHLLVCGEQRAGSGVVWLTGWPATIEALVIVSPSEKNVMYMEWYNHVPLATRMARHTDVRWGDAMPCSMRAISSFTRETVCLRLRRGMHPLP